MTQASGRRDAQDYGKKSSFWEAKGKDPWQTKSAAESIFDEIVGATLEQALRQAITCGFDKTCLAALWKI